MLSKIIDYKRLELEHAKRRVSLRDIKLKARDAAPAQSFTRMFDDGINVIAEVKKASPSAGIIREDFHPVDIAAIYAEHGAKALSVLTDEHFFQGSLDNLIRIKAYFTSASNPLPLLRKDFTLDEYHLYEARSAGADAILLIVAALNDRFRLKDYRQLADELGMTALVEVHDKAEADIAVDIGADLIGVNNRDLKTFETDVRTTSDIKRHLDETWKFALPVHANGVARTGENTPRLISESGLKDRETLLKLKQEGVAGFLIGESLMREKDFGKKLKELVYG
jgi:indole-3-glycerol phosphate synthase